MLKRLPPLKASCILELHHVSVLVQEHTVVVWRNSPVLIVVILLREVLFVLSVKLVERKTLTEVLYTFLLK